MVRAKQLIERGISYIVRHKKQCIRNINTTNSKTVITTDEKLDKIIAILERMEARQVMLKGEVDQTRAHEPPVQGSFATANRPPPSQSHKLAFVSWTLTPAAPEKSNDP